MRYDASACCQKRDQRQSDDAAVPETRQASLLVGGFQYPVWLG